MPTFRVTSPDGLKVDITGDEPPDLDTLDSIFAQAATQTVTTAAAPEPVAEPPGGEFPTSRPTPPGTIVDTNVERQRQLSTITGGPRAALAPAGVALKSLWQEAGMTEGSEGIPAAEWAAQLAPRPEDIPGLAGAFLPGQPQATPAMREAAKKEPLTQIAAGAAAGEGELIGGIVQFLSSPSGMAQFGLSKTPLAPAIYLKWAKDMVDGGMVNAAEAIEAYRRGDWEAFTKHVVSGVGLFVAAGGATKHGFTKLESQAANLAPGGLGFARPTTKPKGPYAIQPQGAQLLRGLRARDETKQVGAEVPVTEGGAEARGPRGEAEAEVSLEQRIADLENDPQVSGQRIVSFGPGGEPVYEPVVRSDAKAAELNRLKAEQQGGGILTADEVLELEEVSREVNSSPIEYLDPQRTDQPYMGGRLPGGNVWVWDPPTGKIFVDREQLADWLERVPDPKVRRTAMRLGLAEETNHSLLTPEEALSFWNNLTAAEKSLHTRRYTGGWSRGTRTEAQMGWEASHALMMRIARLPLQEFLTLAGRERWTTKRVDELAYLIFRLRERVGRTKASKEQRTILDRSSRHLAALKALMAGEKPPMNTPQQNQDDEDAREMNDIVPGGPGPGMAGRGGEPEGRKQPLEGFEALSKKSQALLDEMEKLINQNKLNEARAKIFKLNQSANREIRSHWDKLVGMVKDQSVKKQLAAQIDNSDFMFFRTDERDVTLETTVEQLQGYLNEHDARMWLGEAQRIAADYTSARQLAEQIMAGEGHPSNIGPGVGPGMALNRRYHGSRREFEKWDPRAVTTGEGAASYGHPYRGGYFADVKDVAENYAGVTEWDEGFIRVKDRNLAFWSSDEFKNRDEEIAVEKLVDSSGDFDAARRRVQNTLSEPVRSLVLGELDNLQREGAQYLNKAGQSGAVYTVNLDVEPEHMLDWDKPVSMQSDTIKKLARERSLSMEDTGASLYEALSYSIGEEMRGSGISKKDARLETSKRLNEMGIQGIQYLDQWSRDVSPDFKWKNDLARRSYTTDVVKTLENYHRWGNYRIKLAQQLLEGDARDQKPGGPAREALDALKNGDVVFERPEETRNYVVFDDKRIEITHRNGEEIKKSTPVTDIAGSSLAKTGEGDAVHGPLFMWSERNNMARAGEGPGMAGRGGPDWDAIREAQKQKEAEKRKRGGGEVPLGYQAGGLFGGLPSTGSGAAAEHAIPEGKMPAPPTAVELQWLARQFVREEVEPRSIQARKMRKGVKAEEAAAAGELTKPVNPTYKVPSFKGFTARIRQRAPSVKPEQLTDLWMDAMTKHLERTDDARLEALRKGMQLEKKFGISQISKGAVEEVPMPEFLESQRESRQALDEAAYARSVVAALESDPKSMESRMVGEGKTVEEWKGRVRAAENRAVSAQAYTRHIKEGYREVEKASEARQRYRTRIMSELLTRFWEQTQPKADIIDRASIGIDDIDFSNEKIEHDGWMDITKGQSESPLVLFDILADGSRRSSDDPVSWTQSLVVLLHRRTGQVELVSTYPVTRTREGNVVERKTMVTDPGSPSIKKRRNVPIPELLSNYRPIYKILLKEPVQNFNQHFKSIEEFNEALGKEGQRMARQYAFAEFEPQTPELTREQEAKILAEIRGGRVADEGAPIGARVKDVTEPGQTGVFEGEGGGFTGTEADIVRAGAGLGRRGAATESRGSVTYREALALRETVLGDAGLKPKDVTPEVMEALLKNLADRSDSGKMTGRDWSVISALQKAARILSLKNADWSTEKVKNETLNQFQRAISQSETQADFVAEVMGRFGYTARFGRRGGWRAPAPVIPGAAGQRGISREVTLPRAVAPTTVRLANVPAGVWPKPTTTPPVPRQAAPEPIRQPYLTPEQQAALPKPALIPRYPEMKYAKPAGGPVIEAGKGIKPKRRVPYVAPVEGPGMAGRGAARRAKAAADAVVAKAKDLIRTPDVPNPEAIMPDVTSPIPRFIPNVNTQLTQAMGVERIPLIGRLWGPRARVRDAADREMIGYSVKRQVGKSQAALIGKRLEAYDESLGKPFAQDENGQFTNVSVDKGTSLYPSDLFEEWQREFIVPERMRALKEFSEDEVLSYERKHPKHISLTEEQEIMFRELLRHVEDGYKYLEEKNAKLEFYGGISKETRAAQQLLVGLPKDIEVYPFPRVALYKREIGPIETELRRRIGGQYEVEQERLYKTEEQGQKTTFYEPEITKRMVAFVQRIYKAVADTDLANSEVLKGKKPSERVEDLALEYEAELRSGEMTQQDIIDLSKQARLGREAFVEGHPGFAGKIYPIEIANRLNRAFGEQSHFWVRAASELSTMTKAFMLTGDLAQYLQQGAVLMFRSPTKWATATEKSLRSISDPLVTGRYLMDPKNYEAATEFIQSGGSLGHLQDFMSGAQKGELATRIPYVRQVVIRSGRAFGTFFDLSKIEMWKALRENTPREEWARTVEMIENMMLSGKMEAAGVHPGRIAGERVMLMAPAYYRGAVQLVAGLAERGVSGREARRALGSYAAGITLGMVGLYLASGMSWDEIKRRLTPGMDNKQFLTYPVKIGNRTVEVGPGGIVLNLASLGTDMAMTAIESPKDLVSYGSKNPLMRWLKSKMGPVPSAGLEAITGEDVIGRPSGPVKSVARMFQPIAAQQFMEAAMREEKLPATVEAAASFGGLRASSPSASTLVSKLARDYVKKEGIGKVTGWNMRQTGDPSYSKMRSALSAGNPKRASKIMDSLLETRTEKEVKEEMKQWSKSPFTGNKTHEKKFVASLDEDQMDLYSEAVAERQEILDRFKEMLDDR